MSGETSERVAAIAAMGLRCPSLLSQDEIKTLAASCLAQREDDPVEGDNAVFNITLRDWFAGQALVGQVGEYADDGIMALTAYNAADAMLEARGRK